MTAVAVWQGRHLPELLLQARLARGWQPTATATQQGMQVLGYAACIWSAPTKASREQLG